MNVMLADVERSALDSAVNSLHHYGPKVRGIGCDVADPGSVDAAAKVAFEAFGHVHVVCNNAGVAAGGGIDNISLDNWRWVIDVNLMGVCTASAASCRISARTARAVTSSTPRRWPA
jgi:NAD(P)-dependent dehydrogenase (short-subunit alcohol dehydrogenase family)